MEQNAVEGNVSMTDRCKKYPRRFDSLVLVWVASVCLLFQGCGGSAADSYIAKTHDTNLKRVTSLYSFFMDAYSRAPENREELESFIDSLASTRSDDLEKIGVDATNLGPLFMGQRDNKNLVVRYGKSIRSKDAVVFEAVGVEEKRFVGFANGRSREVEIEEYDKLLAGDSAYEGSEDALSGE